MAIKLVIDSTADLPRELIEAYGMTMVPLNVHFGDEQFKDQVDFSSDEFFAKVANSPVHPRTSQPAPGDFLEIYQRLLAEGHEILSLHISSDLSGTYQSAVMAKEMLPAGSPVEIVDSRSASAGIGLMALEVAKRAENGASMAELVDWLAEARQRMRIVLAVETLEYLQKNGRIGRAAAMVGGLMGIRPILQVDEGVVAPLDKVRGRAKVLPRVVELASQMVAPGSKVRVAVLHGDAEEAAKAWLEAVKPIWQIEEAHLFQLGATVGVHVGPGTVGLCFYEVF